ncbi:hypothetical protein [Streptomyces niveus]|uniref:hypothetical protein n=1 Tax=Streptomyces niveus TaxID=193462 RepID=UPI0036CB22CD
MIEIASRLAEVEPDVHGLVETHTETLVAVAMSHGGYFAFHRGGTESSPGSSLLELTGIRPSAVFSEAACWARVTLRHRLFVVATTAHV